MVRVREIKVTWKSGVGARRKIVGVLKRSATNGITFQYSKSGCHEAIEEGFSGYTGFPLDYEKIYEEKNLDIFSLRLVPFERKESATVLKFWEAEGIKDKFDLLALTQGLLPTDNFEFLGLFYPTKNFRFVTDVAALSHISLPKGSIKIGDTIEYTIEDNNHAFKKKAVKLFKDEFEIGYIKNVHNNIFLEANEKIKLTVKGIEENGIIKNIFLLVDSTYFN